MRLIYPHMSTRKSKRFQPFHQALNNWNDSCIYSDEQSGLSNQLKNFSLEVDADFEKIREIRSEEKIKSQELLRKSTDYNSKSCNLFSTLLDSEIHQQLAESKAGKIGF